MKSILVSATVVLCFLFQATWFGPAASAGYRHFVLQPRRSTSLSANPRGEAPQVGMKGTWTGRWVTKGRFADASGPANISYVAADPAAYLEILRRVLPNEWHANAVSELFRGIAEGGLKRTTDTFRKLMGREPISLTQFLRDHIAAFR